MASTTGNGLLRTSVIALMMVGSGFVMAQVATSQEAAKPQLSKEEERKLNEFRAELEIGRNMAGRLITYYGEYNDEPLNA